MDAHLFIIVDGLPSAGKGVVCKILVDYLGRQGYSATLQDASTFPPFRGPLADSPSRSVQARGGTFKTSPLPKSLRPSALLGHAPKVGASSVKTHTSIVVICGRPESIVKLGNVVKLWLDIIPRDEASGDHILLESLHRRLSHVEFTELVEASRRAVIGEMHPVELEEWKHSTRRWGEFYKLEPPEKPLEASETFRYISDPLAKTCQLPHLENYIFTMFKDLVGDLKDARRSAVKDDFNMVAANRRGFNMIEEMMSIIRPMLSSDTAR